MSELAVDLVLNPVDASWPQVLGLAAAAEVSGYSGLWVLDHVSGAPFGAATTSECFTLLGALAASVPRLPMGPLVVNAAARPVALTTLGFETLERLLGPRLRIGLGAGAGQTGPFAVEHELLGHPVGTLAERHERVGRTIEEVRLRPSLRRTPVVVGANSLPLARLAGRAADGVNLGVDHPRRDELAAAASAAAAERSGPPFEVSCWARWRPELNEPEHRDRRGLARLGITRLMLAVRPAELAADQLPPVRR